MDGGGGVTVSLGGSTVVTGDGDVVCGKWRVNEYDKASNIIYRHLLQLNH